MTAFDCAVTNSPADALPIAPPQNPVFCRDDPSSCTSGSKRPIYAYNSPSNVPWIDNYNRAGYHQVRALAPAVKAQTLADVRRIPAHLL